MAEEGGGGRRRILPDDKERGCASNFPMEASEDDVQNALELHNIVHQVNCRLEGGPGLSQIVYRGSRDENDIRHHVFRFDLRDYSDIFRNGLRARPRDAGTPIETYYNLLDHVNHGGAPVSEENRTPHGFVSTTSGSSLGTRYRNPAGTVVYRYEIYGPGGINVTATLGDRYGFPGQHEVAFVAGIAPEYIRAVQRWTVVDHDALGYAVLRRLNPDDPSVILNINFRLPQPDPERPFLIMRPAYYYYNRERELTPLRIVIYLRSAEPQRERREVCTESEDLIAIDRWNTYDVVNCESYIDAAFQSSRADEAYVFMGNEFVLLNYAPGATNDWVLSGPQLICDGFPSLANTPFGEYGIDCAFKIHYENEAFIFSDNLCARLNFTPDGKITKGPQTIASMFPFFKGKVFEKGVDAAFESSRKYEAYIFSSNQYALINYREPHLIAIRLISEGFPSLKDTVFKDGIDAAFASHRWNEAYIFKGKKYALINFAPGTLDDRVIGGVKEISPNWPSLRSILPRKNIGIDVHDHSHSKPGGHTVDEL